MQWVVVGIGVNVNAVEADFPEELRELATSVRLERGVPAPRALLVAACLSALEEWLDRHAEEGFEPVRQAWRERSDTLGREVMVRTGAGELAGTAEDVDAGGALLLRVSGRIRRVLSGDVLQLRPRAP